MNTFIVLKFLTQLATPPGLLAGGLVVGVVLVVLRLPRLGRLVAALAIAQAVILSFDPVADALLLPLENQARAAAADAPPCCYDAIVVLGAGVVPAAPPQRPNAELTDSSDRLWHAARLYRRGVAPRLILSGGGYVAVAKKDGPTQTEAEAMRQVLIDLGVPAERIVLEGRSLNTIDNIREVRALVGTERVALVTSGYHMPRALRLARLAHLNAAAFPTDWQVVQQARPEWEAFMPSVEALWHATIAIRELIALAFDRRGDSLTP